MATIVTRAGKGSPLTFTEVDANFTNLNNDKLEKSGGTITGATAVEGQATFSVGTAVAPGVAFIGDTNTGLFSPSGGDVIAFSAGGAERVRIATTGLTSNFIGAFLRPSDFWTSSSGYFAAGANVGGLATEGSSGVYLTSNGYRNNAGTWTSYSAGGQTGASQIELLPTGAISFRTDANKASGSAVNPTQRMTIRADGNIGVGAGGAPSINFQLASNITGGSSSYGVRQIQTIQSDVSTALVYQTNISTVASAFTVANLRHFHTAQGTIGAGSVVTNQVGYFAEGTMIGAANNYGFQGAIANATQRTITSVERTSNVVTITTSAAHGFTAGQQVVIAATTNTGVNGTFTITAVPTTTTLQYAQTGVDIVSVADGGTVNSAGRYNLYMSGNAPNYMAGRVGIGAAAIVPGYLLDVAQTSGGVTGAIRSTGTTGSDFGSLFLFGGTYNTQFQQYGNGPSYFTTIGTAMFVQTSTAAPIAFVTNSIERVRITSGGAVGINTSSPNAAALLDLTSTTQGFLPPRMTTTQRDAISTPPDGLMIYNTTLNAFQGRAGGAWVSL